jgi:hypothetical protein
MEELRVSFGRVCAKAPWLSECLICNLPWQIILLAEQWDADYTAADGEE